MIWQGTFIHQMPQLEFAINIKKYLLIWEHIRNIYVCGVASVSGPYNSIFDPHRHLEQREATAAAVVIFIEIELKTWQQKSHTLNGGRTGP